MTTKIVKCPSPAVDNDALTGRAAVSQLSRIAGVLALGTGQKPAFPFDLALA